MRVGIDRNQRLGSRHTYAMQLPALPGEASWEVQGQFSDFTLTSKSAGSVTFSPTHRRKLAIAPMLNIVSNRMENPMNFRFLMTRPSAFMPLVMSFAALAVVLGHIGM